MSPPSREPEFLPLPSSQLPGELRKAFLSTCTSSPPGAERLSSESPEKTGGRPARCPRREAEIKLAIPIPTTHGRYLGGCQSTGSQM